MQSNCTKDGGGLGFKIAQASKRTLLKNLESLFSRMVKEKYYPMTTIS